MFIMRRRATFVMSKGEAAFIDKRRKLCVRRRRGQRRRDSKRTGGLTYDNRPTVCGFHSKDISVGPPPSLPPSVAPHEKIRGKETVVRLPASVGQTEIEPRDKATGMSDQGGREGLTLSLREGGRRLIQVVNSDLERFAKLVA